MSSRVSLLRDLVEKQTELLRITKKVTPVYYPQEVVSVDQKTYEASMRKLAELSKEIFELKNKIAELPKEASSEVVKLKDSLFVEIDFYNKKIESLNQKINQSQDWAKNNLMNEKAEAELKRSQIELVLSLL